MNKNLILIITAFFLSFSCSERNKKEEQSRHYIKSNITLDFKSIFEWPQSLKVEDVIYLDKDSNALVSIISKMVVSPDQGIIAILDKKQSKIFVYNENGKIISVLDRKGSGPQEIMDVRDFQINFADGIIEVLDYKRIQRFNLNNLNFIDTINLKGIKGDNNYISFLSFNGVYYLWTNIPAEQRFDLVDVSEYNMYHLIRKEGENYDFFIPYKFGDFINQRFYKSNVESQFNISPLMGESKVFKVSKDSVFIAYDFPFSRNGITEDKLNNFIGNEAEILRSEYFKNIFNLRETDNHIFFQFVGKGIIYYALYNKATNSFISLGKSKEVFPQIVASDANFFYCAISPSILETLHSNWKDYKNHPILKSIDLDNFQWQDNPIIIKFKVI